MSPSPALIRLEMSSIGIALVQKLGPLPVRAQPANSLLARPTVPSRNIVCVGLYVAVSTVVETRGFCISVSFHPGIDPLIACFLWIHPAYFTPARSRGHG